MGVLSDIISSFIQAPFKGTKKLLKGDFKGAINQATIGATGGLIPGLFKEGGESSGLGAPNAADESIDIEKQKDIALSEAAKEEKERRRRVALLGRKSTFKTSPFGLRSEANVRQKTLLGN